MLYMYSVCKCLHLLSLQVLKRDKDLYELSKIDEQKSSGQPANTDETEITESKKTPDVLTQPLRYADSNSHLSWKH